MTISTIPVPPRGLEAALDGRMLRRVPEARAVAALLKPVTWFPPMWAFGCGVVSIGVAGGARGGERVRRRLRSGCASRVRSCVGRVRR